MNTARGPPHAAIYLRLVERGKKGEALIIELMRAHTPEEVGLEEPCAICEREFRTEHVLAQVSTEAGTLEANHVCPDCVELLGTYRPEKFPTLEEYEEAKQRFSGPIWEDRKVVSDAVEQGAPYEAALEANRIVRA
jgi:hypothetical protein